MKLSSKKIYFSQASSWLIKRFVADVLNKLINDEEDNEENFEDMSLSTRDYLDMIGLEDFSDCGWAPGDDDD